jgi:(heptosyl)LPS beta-1,4-glucosyltransferase
MSTSPHLTAIILTYNEETHIQDCLASVQFADAIVVFDSLSTDATVKLAQELGAEVIQHPFDNYADQRNAALDAVMERTDWVLFVDADERVTLELAQEVRQAIANPDYVAWRIPRYNYLFGKLTKGAGWYPDHQTRLLKIGRAHYDPQVKVHEVVLMQGDEGTMKEHFVHYNYEHIRQFIQKQRKYVRYDAQIMFDQGIRPKFRNYILQPLRHFRWRFLQLKGYQDGYHGFRLSAIMAWYEFRKYWILRQSWAQHDADV